jgi:nicotinamidase-related amidase
MASSPNLRRLDPARTQLLVIDVQEKLLPRIIDQGPMVEQIIRMLRAARELALPTTVTEQYTKGLGPSVQNLLLYTEGADRLEKMSFSACRDDPTRQRLIERRRPQVLLAGIEAHVCVLQTALDLLEHGLQSFVLSDAVGSRRVVDRESALTRMVREGVVVTTVESAVFELLGRCDTELFKRLLPIVR